MLLRFLGSPWALVIVWIVGPAIIIAIRQRNKRLAEAPRRPAPASPAPASTPVPGKERDTAITQVPGMTPPDVTPGFRDLRWGDPVPGGMELVSQDGEEAVYVKPGDLLRVEDVPVEAIHYHFTAGAFAAVRVDAPLHAGDALVRALSQKWGGPDTADPRALKQQWGRLVTGTMATAAVLEKSPVSRRTTLFLFRKAPAPPK